MQLQRQPGYTGKLLRVDLTCGSIHEEILKPEVVEQNAACSQALPADVMDRLKVI